MKILAIFLSLFSLIYAIDIPIKVREALPANITIGWNRINEPVKLGIPLMDKEGISSISQIGLQELSIYQFRVLERYPSGNIRWLLADLPATVSASDTTVYHLVNGSGQPSGMLATETGTNITVNTEGLSATILKKPVNIIDQLTINGVSYVEAGNDGGLKLTANGQSWSSNADEDSCSAVIEENGPYRTCILIRGVFQRTGSDSVCMHYTLRLHFVKGSPTIRSILTLKNDLRAQTTPVSVNGFHWSFKTNLTTSPSYILSGTDGIISGSLTNSVSLVQGYSFFRDRGYKGYANRWGVGRGYRVSMGSTLLHDWTDSAAYSDGKAELKSGSKRVAVVYKQLSGWWAGGFKLGTDGTFDIAFISNDRDSAVKFSFYAHETREFLLTFGSSVSASDLSHQADYPLFALVDFDRYRRTGAYLGEKRLPDFAEMKNFLSVHGEVTNFRPFNASESVNPIWNTGFSKIGPCRIAASSGGGPDGNMMHADAAILRALQTGWGGLWLLAEGWINGMCDYPIQHAWDFELSALSGNINVSLPLSGSNTANGIGMGYKMYFEGEHPHWLGIIPWYYLTGDERVKENWRDMVNHRKHHRWEAKKNLLAGNSVGYERVYTYDMRDVVAGNFITPPDSIERSFLQFVLQNLIYPNASDADHTKPGWDLKRGFWSAKAAASATGSRIVHSFFTLEKHAENSGLVYSMLPALFSDSTAMLHKLRDRLLGLAYFNEKEQFVRRPGSYGTFYDYNIDSVQTDTSNATYSSDATFLQAFAFEETGDTQFLETGKRLYYPVYNATNCDEYFNKLSMLRFIYDYNRKDSLQVSYPVLNAVNNGNGSWTLNWNRPTGGVTRYILKYSEKNIVPNLNFNRISRTYEFDTTANVNFWAANEPSKGPLNNSTSFNVEGLNPAKTYNFSLKAIRDNSIEQDTLSVEVEYGFDYSKLPKEICVSPNPFNPSISISIKGWSQKASSVGIFDVKGRKVADLTSRVSSKGLVVWDAFKFSSGIYVIGAQINGKLFFRRITLMK